MAIRTIRKEGDPILRKISRPIDTVNDRIRELAADMIETMQEAEGAGLAAPQVGVLRRLVIVDMGEGPVAMINPEILSEDGESIEPEGCLSIPGLLGTVKRPARLTVRFQTLEEQTKEMEAEGFFAKAVCHEIDHLNGILFRDLVIEELDPEDLQAEEEEEAESTEEGETVDETP